MRDILNIARLDYLCVRHVGFPVWCVIGAACLLFSLFFSPMAAAYMTFSAIFLVFPLSSIADKSGFHKLYGILPVKRRAITRGRFAYIFTVFFVTELTELGILYLAKTLNLYRLLLNQGSELALMVAKSFDPQDTLALNVIIGGSLFACAAFLYMEMMGQIFGHENEMKILGISTIVLIAVSYGTLWLANHEILPMFNWGTISGWFSDHTVFVRVGAHFAVLGLCFLFGEITAARLAKREL